MNQELKASRIEELGKVWTPETNWRIPTVMGEVTFVFPAFGPNFRNEVVEQVLANKQRLPMGEQSAFMLDEAYNSTDEDVKNSPRTEFVRKNIMYRGWLWVPNVNVWTPRNISNPGMYTVFDENGEDLAKERSVAELEDRLSGGSTEKGVRFSKDREVAFSPLGLIKKEYHEKGTLSQDGAFIANYGVEGSEKLDAVAKAFSFRPYSWIVENTTDKPIQTLSALHGRRYVVGDRLFAYFNSKGTWGGYVLPVSCSSLSAEGTAPKN